MILSDVVGVSAQFVVKKANTGSNIWYNSNITIESGDIPQYFYTSVRDVGTVDTVVYAFLSRGTELPSVDDYTPYTGTTATLSLPETIYGGTVDAVTGAGSKTWGYIASYNGESLPGEWISDRDVYSAGTTPTTGAQVAYKLVTPEPFQVTDLQPLPAISGQNDLTTNADSLTVTGRADPTHTIQTLSDRIAALESETIEGGTIA